MMSRITTLMAGLIVYSFATNAFASYGRTPGQFTVSPTGSAQYSIPLWTPPGIRAIKPNLALVYDSHLPYGLMGPGWVLSGLSTISRCNPTYAQDGAPASITLTSADGLCLDGNRLRTTGTGTYQTEIANFSQVTASGTAGNGPSYFTVKGKDGQIYEYGNTTDSKILPSSSSTTPYVWALDKVTDRYGNHMTFTYFQAGGSYVPLSIQYAATSGSTTFPYKINFTYTTKSANDTLTKYVAGSQIQQTNQLSTITVTSSGTTAREYKLLYTTSSATLRATLTSIQECGGSGGTDCLAPTTVAYQYGTAGVVSPTTASGSGATNGTVYSVDIDGDGKQDLIFATTSGSNYVWSVQFATATGYGSPISVGASTVGTADFLIDDFDATGGAEILAPVGGIWNVYKWNGTSFIRSPTGLAVVASALGYSSADVDGDGKPDLVYLSQSVGYSFSVQFNTTSNGAVTFNPIPVVTNSGLFMNPRLVGNNQQPSSSVKHFDFDGDGRQDLVLTFNTHTKGGPQLFAVLPLLSRGAAGFVLGTEVDNTAFGFFEAVNWNDDACTDIVNGTQLYISQCNGNSDAFVFLPGAASVALDWDGDGRTDFLANIGGTTWQLIRSVGNTFAPAVSTGIPLGSGTWVVTDKNGDGLHDIVFANSAASNAIYYGLHNGAGVHPDLATSFTDGEGNAVKPTYGSLAQGITNLYIKGTNAVYPYQNYIGPLYVVSQATFSDPTNFPNGTYQHTYAYFWGWKNLLGRGFSGFNGGMTDTDRRTGVNHYPYYRTDFPYTGMLSQDWISQPNTGTLFSSKLNNTLTVVTLDATPNNQRYFPYVSQSTATEYQVGGSNTGALITTAVTNYTFDTSGNATNVSTVVTDNDSTSPYLSDSWTTTTVNSISPDTSTNWCLNLPTQTTVTNSSTAPGGAVIIRTVAYNSPDYVHCRQTEKVIEPNSSLYKVVEDYGYDPTTGNLTKDTVTGAGMASRVTNISWNSTAQFPATISNPLSQSITLGFDPNTGMKTSQTDPNYTTSNPIKTTWGYDNFARKTSESRPDGTSTTWVYDNCTTGGCANANNKMTVTQTALNVGGSTLTVRNAYLDSFDRTLVSSGLMLNGAYDRQEVQYDNLGNVHLIGAPCTFVGCTVHWTTNTYDSLHRLTASQLPINATNPTMIQYSGRTTTTTDPLGHTTTKITMPTGTLGRSQDHNGYHQDFTYDAFGSLLKVIDSASPSNTLFTAQYAYGIGTFQTGSTDADLSARINTLDALGEVSAYTDAKGQNFSFLYDALSRPTSRTEPDLTTTWTWGNTATNFNIGRLQSVSAVSSVGTYSESYLYDSKSRPSTKTIVIPQDATYTYTTTYNATTGLLDTLQYPVSTSSYRLKLQYSYINGILNKISDFTAGTAYWTANTTNPRGQLTKETLGNGVLVNHSFDAVTGVVGSIQAGKGGGTALQNNSYLFDVMGNLTQRQDNNQGATENIYYDNLYRLDHTTVSGTTTEARTYDVTGNVITWQYNGATVNQMDYTTPQAGCTYYANSQPHAVRRNTQGPYINSYCYDANGNMLGSPSGFNWTSYNQPNYFDNGGAGNSQFYYDANHQRYKQVASYSGSLETTMYVGGLMEKVINSAGTAYRHYIPAGSNTVLYTRLSTGTNPTYYIAKDHLGSTSLFMDATGALVARGTYSSTGIPLAANWGSFTVSTTGSITRHGFTGQEMDDNLYLVNLNGRLLDSSLGRMLSPDPYVTNPGNTQSFNRYSYVNNNPLSNVDPSGFDTLPDYVVNCCSSSGGDGGIIGSIISFFSGLFGGGGGSHLSASQQAAQSHGVNLSLRLPSLTYENGQSFINNPDVQAAAADTVGADPNHYELNAGPAAAGAPINGVPQIDGLTVTGHVNYGYNFAPFAAAATRGISIERTVGQFSLLGMAGGSAVGELYLGIQGAPATVAALQQSARARFIARMLAKGVDAAYGKLEEQLSEQQVISEAQSEFMKGLDKLSGISTATENAIPEVTGPILPW